MPADANQAAFEDRKEVFTRVDAGIAACLFVLALIYAQTFSQLHVKLLAHAAVKIGTLRCRSATFVDQFLRL